MAQATLQEIKGHLAARRDFTGNSMTGEQIGSRMPHLPIGQMSDENYAQLLRHNDQNGLSYLVMSHGTVIAYVVRGLGTVIPEAKYSVTTTRAQNLCRDYL